MRIGIDVSLLLYPEVVGMRLHLERLLDALLRVGEREEFVLYHHTRRSWGGVEALERYRRPHVHLSPAPAAVRCIPDSAWWLGYHPPLEKILREPVDVFHAGEFLFPRSGGTPLVGTLYDLTPELFPHLHLWPNRVRHRRQMRWLSRHADRAVAISASTARDFRCLFGPLPPIDVVHPGFQPAGNPLPEEEVSRALAGTRERLRLGDAPYVLCVGTVEPRKNGERLVRAFERVEGEGDVHLVFAGRRGWRSEGTYSAAAASRAAERIHFAGPVSSLELAALYRGATVFAYPSLYEGFGLPVLEAMGAGVPVLTSGVSSLPEVAGDAALLVDPEDVSSVAEALRRLLREPRLREELAARGRARAARFSWDAAAAHTLETYRRAAGEPKRSVPTPGDA